MLCLKPHELPTLARFVYTFVHVSAGFLCAVIHICGLAIDRAEVVNLRGRAAPVRELMMRR